MPQHGVTLSEDLAVELDHRYVAGGIHLEDLFLLVLWPFIEGETLYRVSWSVVVSDSERFELLTYDVFVGNACIFPEQPNRLTSPFRSKIEIVYDWDAADGFVRRTGRTVLLPGRHFNRSLRGL